ncbi:hypothetical protein ACH46L_31760 [Streptomyces althioticus]|uniref:hypothetical protein n=1 Tax=Streptomyces althioticus TaxID=83380 RepID=UPI00379F4B38
MGRGLSPLQRQILLIAEENRRARRRRGGRADVYTAEVYARVYGFEPMPGRDPRDPSTETFSHEQIGASAYNRAAASVSRALRRLEERGLLTREPRAGGRLTPAGQRQAAALIADDSPGAPPAQSA